MSFKRSLSLIGDIEDIIHTRTPKHSLDVIPPKLHRLQSGLFNVRHNSIPLTYINQQLRPLHFGEPILDSFNKGNVNQTSVDILQLNKLTSNSKYPTLITLNTSKNIKYDELTKIKDYNIFEKHTTIIGHSRTSPSRQLKKYLSCGSHDGFLKKLKNHKYYTGDIYPKLGVVVVLSDADNNILLTRRSYKMRSFPLGWVNPGGGLDQNETLIECGIRELYEETGIKIDKNKDTICLLTIWDSQYPDTVSFNHDIYGYDNDGCPIIKYHHIIPIFLIKLMDRIKPNINLCPNEVDIGCWVNINELKHLLNDDSNNINIELDGIKAYNGESIEVKPGSLRGIYPNKYKQGIARGHKFALHKLIERLE